MPSRTEAVTAAAIAAARPEVERVARRTPVLSTRTISERAGGMVALKAENLQRTGSFKVRGASAKLAALGEEGCASGVVAASAGNHAQGLAAAAAARGVRCEVFVPADAPIAKAEAARGQGAIVHVGGASLEECLAAAQARARERRARVRPPVRRPGHRRRPGVARARAARGRARPRAGSSCRSAAAGWRPASRSRSSRRGPRSRSSASRSRPAPRTPASLEAGAPVTADSALTIADGIAVKRPGDLTLALLGEWLDGMAVVEDEDAAEAMVLLLERCKLVVEGAGAVGVAALLGGQVAPADARHDGRDPRRAGTSTRACCCRSRAGTRRWPAAGSSCSAACPTGRASSPACSTCVAEAGGNVVDVSHVREGFDLHVRETAVELVLETRGREHADRVHARDARRRLSRRSRSNRLAVRAGCGRPYGRCRDRPGARGALAPASE